MMTWLTDLGKKRIMWPLGFLVLLVLLNTAFRHSFLSITVLDGRLYGSLIDILRNCAPLMLVSLGMCLVIATRGIDLSVGAADGDLRGRGADDHLQVGRPPRTSAPSRWRSLPEWGSPWRSGCGTGSW